jgi:hypothetical protein
MSKKQDEKQNVQLALFEGPDAPDKVLEYVKSAALCEEAQVKMFDLPNILDVLPAYIMHDELCEKAELRMINHPDAINLIIAYFDGERTLCENVQIAMLDLPIAKEVMQIYIDYTVGLYDNAEAKFVNMKGNMRLFSEYVDEFPLVKAGKKALLTRKDGKTHILYYIKRYSLDKDEFFMMMEHPDADELVKAYRFKCDDWVKEFNRKKKKS